MKQCPVCQRLFEPQVPHQEYDNWNCRRRAERQRARARARSGVAATPTAASESHVQSAVNPTDGTLDLYAQGYINEPDTKPMLFSGQFNKQWQPPNGVVFMEQEGGGWLMANEKIFT
jgi:hypothetical protein